MATLMIFRPRLLSHIEQVSCVHGEGLGNVANTLQERDMVECVLKLPLKGAIGWQVK
jgi:hypothetical protein